MEEGTGPASAVAVMRKERIGWILSLFLLTVVTTVVAGAFQAGGDPLSRPADIIKGFPFSFTLLLILLSHEMGHYFASRIHGVDASLPYFIPAPPNFFMIGTFGAFIRIRSPVLYKNALFDIAVSGPIAGFLVSCGALLIGLPLSDVTEGRSLLGAQTIEIGSSPIFYLFVNQLIGSLPQDYVIGFHPVAFAGWLGLFITCINLIPIGQLDGGHMIYALSGKNHRMISIFTVLILLGVGIHGWKGWWIWGILGLFLGLRHPPLVDQDVPIGALRRMIGVLTILLFIGTFILEPFLVAGSF